MLLFRATNRAILPVLWRTPEQTERRIDGMVTRLGALVVVVAGLLFAALHYGRRTDA